MIPVRITAYISNRRISDSSNANDRVGHCVITPSSDTAWFESYRKSYRKMSCLLWKLWKWELLQRGMLGKQIYKLSTAPAMSGLTQWSLDPQLSYENLCFGQSLALLIMVLVFFVDLINLLTAPSSDALWFSLNFIANQWFEINDPGHDSCGPARECILEECILRFTDRDRMHSRTTAFRI